MEITSSPTHSLWRPRGTAWPQRIRGTRGMHTAHKEYACHVFATRATYSLRVPRIRYACHVFGMHTAHKEFATRATRYSLRVARMRHAHGAQGSRVRRAHSKPPPLTRTARRCVIREYLS
jgi:hypothetical protein